MANWYASVYKGFIVAGLVSFIVGFFTQGITSLNSYIAGYSILILAIAMMLIIIFNNILKVTEASSTLQTISSILISSGPFLLMLAVISLVLYLIVKYKSNIIENHVSSGYYSFSNITALLIFIQLYVIYTNIFTDKFQNTGKIEKVTSSIIYLLGVLSSMTVAILYIILKYYTTDGFATIN
jgi:type III secretory pathway component EscS